MSADKWGPHFLALDQERRPIGTREFKANNRDCWAQKQILFKLVSPERAIWGTTCHNLQSDNGSAAWF